MGSFSHPVCYKDQKYVKLKKTHQKLKKMFTDPQFPAIASSIGNYPNLPENLEWKRPRDICEMPCLFAEDICPETVIHGKLSSNWFVSACSILAGVGELCYRIIPDYSKQEWNNSKREEYVGIFHFQFWRFGQWVDVVIDDLLPTVDNKLIFTHSSRPNEFWVSLVEKAYAKLHGSYECLEGGHTSDALVDFTGGVSEVLDLRAEEYSGLERRSALFTTLQHEMTNHSLVSTSIAVLNKEEANTRTDMGLYRGEAYVITSVKKVYLGETSLRNLFKERNKLKMIRLRDPHKRDPPPSPDTKSEEAEDEESKDTYEYAYSTSKLTRLLSRSSEWAKVRDSEKERMGLTVDHKDEFWMPLEDFVSQFTELNICRLFNTNVFALMRSWKEASVRGLWSTGIRGSLSDRAGGSPDFTETFLRNPQYMFDITSSEEELIIQMLQWDTSGRPQSAGIQSLLIGFSVIKVEENRKYRLHKQWAHNPTVISYSHIRRREIFYKGPVTRGRYIIIPTTHKPGDIGGYFIRILSNSNIKLREVKKDAPSKPWFCCSFGYPVWVTTITIKGAENLKKIDRLGSCDAYCQVKCEGKSAKTLVQKNTLDPTWNNTFVFYRCKMEKPLTIKVYNHNTCLPDNFIGQVQIPAPLNQHPSPLRVEILGKGEVEPMQGALIMEVFTSDDFQQV